MISRFSAENLKLKLSFSKIDITLLPGVPEILAKDEHTKIELN